MSPGALPAIIVFSFLAAGSPPSEDSGALTLDQAMALAMEANPDLVAARLGRDVAKAGVAIARQRPNPEFGFEAERETPHQAYSLSLPVETAGKRRHRVAVSEAAAVGAEAGIARLTVQTRVAVRRA